ncbi:hypothetical protein CHLRE_12g507200v5 [Chlamydomonas reinhardtii]|uniref:U-box domain-containing protein n=1 Tax=Chlamydomonas reinhardtii TaxID=3055 RepID=A0A2K3D2T9_CHLRE|nr:uncharacterized protein CHLRE_12g507200v5 [Chlamydomonas reinhardtii]PNW74858.1 hypothetical protein CHLRE_12g507200v5 [Chlamydomonas reinhardtii]
MWRGVSAQRGEGRRGAALHQAAATHLPEEDDASDRSSASSQGAPAATPAAASTRTGAAAPSGGCGPVPWLQWPMRGPAPPPSAHTQTRTPASAPPPTPSVRPPPAPAGPASATTAARAASAAAATASAAATAAAPTAASQQAPAAAVVAVVEGRADSGASAGTSNRGGGEGGAGTSNALVVYRPPLLPAEVVVQVAGRVAGTAWTALKLLHRYTLVPAASWALRSLRAFMEERVRVQRALASRALHVPRLDEPQLRPAADTFSPSRRTVASPFGLVFYSATLRLPATEVAPPAPPGGGRAGGGGGGVWGLLGLGGGGGGGGQGGGGGGGAATGRKVLAEVEVAVRQTMLWSMADVDDFFAEAGAGWQFLARLEVTAPAAATRATANTAARGQRAATAAGSSDSSSSAARVVRPCANVVSYIGCCPASAAHVYERPEYDAVLRTALLPCGAGFLALGLDRWEVRLALCGQLVAAARELVKRGVVARDLNTSHVILQLQDPSTSSASSSTSSNPTPSSASASACGLLALLAPGCGLRELPPLREITLEPPQQQQQQQQQPEDRRTPAPGGAAGSGEGVAVPVEADVLARNTRVAAMARGLGDVLLQLLTGPDATPSAGTLLAALCDAGAARLTAAARAAPPLTEEAAFPLLAAVHPLLVWGQAGEGSASSSSAGGAATRRGGGETAGGGSAVARDAAPLLQQHLAEVAAAVAEAELAVEAAAAAGSRRPQPQPQPVQPPQPQQQYPPAAAVATAEDPFADATAPPLPPPPPSALDGYPYPHPPHQRPQPHTPSAPSPPSWHVPPIPSPSPFPPPSATTANPTPANPTSPAPATAAAAPPGELVCPITQELFEDPVVAADGHSYERAAIARWLADGLRTGRPASSPLTGAALPHTALTPNYALRGLAREWRERHPNG